MTPAERKAIRQEAHARVSMAHAVASKLTGDMRLRIRVARVLLAACSTRELGCLAGWKRIRRVGTRA